MSTHKEVCCHGWPLSMRCQQCADLRKPAISTERETDSDAHAEDVWHVRYDGQDFRDG